MSKNRLKSKKRKKEILQTTLAIIYNEGFYSLTIRNIARKIGISEAAIYRHFKSKKEIINTLADWVFSESQLWQIKCNNNNYYQTLRAIMLKLLNHLKDNPEFTSILFHEEIFREYPEIREKFNHHRLQNEKHIIDIIKKGQNKGVFALNVTPHIFALLYMGSIRITVLRWRNSSDKISSEETVNEITKELFKILNPGNIKEAKS